MTDEPLNKAVFEVIALIDAAKGEIGFDRLDDGCQRMLVFVGTRTASGRKVIITDLIGRDKFGSYPTVQKRLDHLARIGWLAMRQDPDDGRALVLELTPSSIEAFNRMSSMLQRFSPFIGLHHLAR